MTASSKIAEMTAEAVQDHLWRKLQAYDALLARSCPEDYYDTEAYEHIRPEGDRLIPQIVLLGKLLGFSQVTMEAICTLIEKWHHHDRYGSTIDASDEANYHVLASFLTFPTRSQAFQALPLPLLEQGRDACVSLENTAIVCRIIAAFNQMRDIYDWQRLQVPQEDPYDPETGWLLMHGIHLLVELLYP